MNHNTDSIQVYIGDFGDVFSRITDVSQLVIEKNTFFSALPFQRLKWLILEYWDTDDTREFFRIHGTSSHNFSAKLPSIRIHIDGYSCAECKCETFKVEIPRKAHTKKKYTFANCINCNWGMHHDGTHVSSCSCQQCKQPDSRKIPKISTSVGISAISEIGVIAADNVELTTNIARIKTETIPILESLIFDHLSSDRQKEFDRLSAVYLAKK